MEIITILRKNRQIFVRQMFVGELDKSKCSTKFLSNNLDNDVLVNVKCNLDGSLDLRGKKEEYRIVVADNIEIVNVEKICSNCAEQYEEDFIVGATVKTIVSKNKDKFYRQERKGTKGTIEELGMSLNKRCYWINFGDHHSWIYEDDLCVVCR